jgi:TorA maturation chaperone TorD
MAAAELSFYRELAALTKRFIEFDCRELQKLDE